MDNSLKVVQKKDGSIVVKTDTKEYLILGYREDSGYKVDMSTALPTDLDKAEELLNAYKKAFDMARETK